LETVTTEAALCEEQAPFGRLSALSITANAIGKDDAHVAGSGWAAVVNMGQMRALTDLRCAGNPLFEGVDTSVEASRNQIIGRVQNLTLLDGSAILATDRIMAEKQYARPGADAEMPLDAESSNAGAPHGTRARARALRTLGVDGVAAFSHARLAQVPAAVPQRAARGGAGRRR
jgi:hypothetical protein